ncbi:hypothetical protein BX661DRAFT_184510 [Kickxella alabastrina]|uniref:uncharacterized protein n=1 Tax=Kickxella alabastrina TaxID=61397 RepID=UPI00221E38D5|nr:uncharacterized protein BX661DRAFT_184510 [Kickxella alabastrina]KAI7825425.1 hypothetical protein BX661DRAFT_184510 [Kickxella alabastrina]
MLRDRTALPGCSLSDQSTSTNSISIEPPLAIIAPAHPIDTPDYVIIPNIPPLEPLGRSSEYTTGSLTLRQTLQLAERPTRHTTRLKSILQYLALTKNSTASGNNVEEDSASSEEFMRTGLVGKNISWLGPLTAITLASSIMVTYLSMLNDSPCRNCTNVGDPGLHLSAFGNCAPMNYTPGVWPLGLVRAAIVDECEACGLGGILLSADAFRIIAGDRVGTVSVSWGPC